MRRGRFVGSCAAAAALSAAPRAASALPMLDPFAPQPGPWHTYEITTQIDLTGDGPAQAWIPVPGFAQALWSRPQPSKWKTNASTVALRRDAASGAQFVDATWTGGAPSITVVSRAATRERAVDFHKPASVVDVTAAERARYTAATALMPTGGTVLATAQKITAGASTELEKARAIYNWVIDNSAWVDGVVGEGRGDAAALLRNGKPNGKSADINGACVALMRAAAIPARLIAGLRVAPSAFDYQSLGVSGTDVSEAQHLRADVFLTGYGWVSCDPADVLKVFADEPGLPKMDDFPVVDARNALFGAAEANWVAYNDATDLVLPGSSGAPLPYFCYPQAERNGVRLEPLRPQGFRYTISARAV